MAQMNGKEISSDQFRALMSQGRVESVQRMSEQSGIVAYTKDKSQFQIICQDNTILVNLICMTMVWVSASFCYYLISFQLKYIQGDIWINSIVSSSSECVAFALSGIIVKKIGLKWTIVMSFIVATVGMINLVKVQP